MKSLVMTAKSSYARFRCPHTTTSALTFTTIHPIAVKGLIGAILGIDYEDLYIKTKDISIGIQVLSPIYKDMQSFNLIAQTGNNGAQNFQSRVQFLRDVSYRIFVKGDESILVSLEKALSTNCYTFTPYLGCTEHIAKLGYEGIYDCIDSLSEYADSVIPREIINIDNSDIHIYSERIPVENNKDREYTRYSHVLFTANKKIPVKPTMLTKVGEYYVHYL